MKINRCPTFRSSNHYVKVFKTEVKEYPLYNAWATKIKHLKFSEPETEGNIKLPFIISFYLYMTFLGHPLITVLCKLITVQRHQYI
jgi:hypothetical protein